LRVSPLVAMVIVLLASAVVIGIELEAVVPKSSCKVPPPEPIWIAEVLPRDVVKRDPPLLMVVVPV
jgi:hypothetical protein